MGKVRRVDLSPDEWLVGAATLRPDERGCYITVCCLIYSYGGPIDDDDRDLAKLCNTTIEKWRRIRASLLARRKLFLRDGKLSNRRCETEIARAASRPPLEEWRQIRAVVFERDNYTCRYCGKRGGPLECDHVIPASVGGAATEENLVTACRPCNRAKGARTPEQWGVA
ncbi:hypothetical protein Sp245p_26085 (plasmid) [Azospirillum baldaniorum]|uniref:HNH nuclease domain-containing protein n=1 Tax=Azospirillum baldaniorum TaxID=1064539 RepID=A0A9P1JZR3_9PROT|nr:YdaU family protein [Azospirillum baldaniorum]AWJ93296.1 hypothetical protein Sp245p_26085 [Azospirillum baldaniorum]TWA77993.1 HNH endonuclease [Azospirillum brasilense]CCD02906.1 protein of unknown function [Azospirillum baldaniorum]